MRTIRASEIGAYLYCRRAWWYRAQGVEPENQAELAGGSEFHRSHGRAVVSNQFTRLVGVLLVLTAIGLLAAGLTSLVLR